MAIENADTENTTSRRDDQANVRVKVNLTAPESEAFRIQARDAGLTLPMYLATLVRQGAAVSASAADAKSAQTLGVAISELHRAIETLSHRSKKASSANDGLEYEWPREEIRKIFASSAEAAAIKNAARMRDMLSVMSPVIIGISAFGIAIGWMLKKYT